MEGKTESPLLRTFLEKKLTPFLQTFSENLNPVFADPFSWFPRKKVPYHTEKNKQKNVLHFARKCGAFSKKSSAFFRKFITQITDMKDTLQMIYTLRIFGKQTQITVRWVRLDV